MNSSTATSTAKAAITTDPKPSTKKNPAMKIAGLFMAMNESGTLEEAASIDID